MKKSGGFTLVEMVVVLAVVAILAAILVPTVAKNINDAKIARAGNEAQVLGAAMASFYKDVGRWPDSSGADNLPGDIDLLRTAQGTLPSQDAGTTDWDDTPWDTFENQLILNTPGNSGVDGDNSYPTTSPNNELIWRGPYITEIKADPWGSMYLCNVDYMRDGAIDAVWVISAGPDRTIRTTYTQALTGTPALNDLAGAGESVDDVGFRLQ
jgi:prepilin-type N-terminal cleavage/methylation domain-containing protein